MNSNRLKKSRIDHYLEKTPYIAVRKKTSSPEVVFLMENDNGSRPKEYLALAPRVSDHLFLALFSL
jgi:hypothetical protein